MTRRGSIAYYLAAWVIGCFIVSLGPWVRGMRLANSGLSRNLLFIYFIASIIGAADMLVFAFSLRVLMRWCKTHALWVWFVAGAGAAFVVTFLLAWGERHWPVGWEQGGSSFLYQCIFAGPSVLRESGPWVVLLDGAVIGAILCLVDRPFSSDPKMDEKPL